LSGLYIVYISERQNEYYSLESNWIELEVSTDFYSEGRRKEGGVQLGLPESGARAYDIPLLGLIDGRAEAGVAFYGGWLKGA